MPQPNTDTVITTVANDDIYEVYTRFTDRKTGAVIDWDVFLRIEASVTNDELSGYVIFFDDDDILTGTEGTLTFLKARTNYNSIVGTHNFSLITWHPTEGRRHQIKGKWTILEDDSKIT